MIDTFIEGLRQALPRPVVVPAPKEYRHLLPASERRAYQAAWRILQINSEELSGYATAARRRIALVDRIAEIINEETKR